MLRKPLQSQADMVRISSILGVIAPIMVIAMIGFIGNEASGFLKVFSLADLAQMSWRPVIEEFGLVPLIVATLTIGVSATGFAILLGIAAAMRLVFFAGDRERILCEAALSVMAGLPSVIVGLVGLSMIVPVFGLSVASGIVTLFVMVFPVFTLLAADALRQERDRLWPAAAALGYARRAFAHRFCIKATLPSLVLAASLALGKALGEATAVSLVIGSVSKNVLPDLFGTVRTITSAILNDHSAATDVHHAALYAAAAALCVLTLAVNLAGVSISTWLRRKLA